jgi:hypothetical protein
VPRRQQSARTCRQIEAILNSLLPGQADTKQVNPSTSQQSFTFHGHNTIIIITTISIEDFNLNKEDIRDEY